MKSPGTVDTTNPSRELNRCLIRPSVKHLCSGWVGTRRRRVSTVGRFPFNFARQMPGNLPTARSRLRRRRFALGLAGNADAMSNHNDSHKGNLRQVAAETFGWTELHPEQLEAMDLVMQGRDVLVILPTGAGKSAIYQVPALLIPGPTLIVSPLLALQHDQLPATLHAEEPSPHVDWSSGAVALLSQSRPWPRSP